MNKLGANQIMARVESLRPLARTIAQETGKSVKLLYFETRKEMEIIQ